MDTTNVENVRHQSDHSGKDQRQLRNRRVPLCNVTNNNQTQISFKKIKKSESSPKSKQTLTDQDSYLLDVVKYIFELETLTSINPGYMDNQFDLKPVMRSILVDWIIQACSKFKVTEETQYYAIQYIDRFLSSELTERSNLQLVGICSIFLACKFEEINVPSMSDLCYITEDTYIPKVYS